MTSSLKKITSEESSWFSKLDIIQYVINNTFHSSIKNSPSKLLLGYEQGSHSDYDFVNCLNQIVKNDLSFKDSRETDKELAKKLLIN